MCVCVFVFVCVCVFVCVLCGGVFPRDLRDPGVCWDHHRDARGVSGVKRGWAHTVARGRDITIRRNLPIECHIL